MSGDGGLSVSCQQAIEEDNGINNISGLCEDLLLYDRLQNSIYLGMYMFMFLFVS